MMEKGNGGEKNGRVKRNTRIRRLSAVTDRRGARTDYTCDRRGRAGKTLRCHGSSLTYTYDAMGSVLTQTDALGNTTRHVPTHKNGNLTT